MLLTTLIWSDVRIEGPKYVRTYKNAVIDVNKDRLVVKPCTGDGMTINTSLVYAMPQVVKMSSDYLRIDAKYVSSTYEEGGQEKIDTCPVTLTASF